MPENQQINTGSFLPTTDIYDSDLINSLDINSDRGKEFLVRLRQSINNVALVVNTKESGYYIQQEFVTGKLYYANTALTSATAQIPTFRTAYRRVVNFGALPNAGTKSVAHGISINSGYRATDIFGASTNPTTVTLIPLPYVSTIGDDIEVWVDATNVNVRTTSNRTAFTQTDIVIEYLKS